MVAGGEGITVGFFLLESGIPEMVRTFEEQPKRLGQPVVLLNQGLIVHLGEKGGLLLVLGRGGDKVFAGLQVKPLLVGQHMVPDVPAAAEGVFKQGGLGRIGVESGLDGAVLDYPAVL